MKAKMMTMCVALAACLPATAAPKIQAAASASTEREWVFVGAVAPKDQEAASLALARAGITTVIQGSDADGYYTHPVDRAHAVAILRADARRNRYTVFFGNRPAAKAKKPSH